MYNNIERSAFRHGEYTGHATGPWRIYRADRFTWRCLPMPNVHPTIAGRYPYGFTGNTLREISATLNRINHLP